MSTELREIVKRIRLAETYNEIPRRVIDWEIGTYQHSFKTFKEHCVAPRLASELANFLVREFYGEVKSHGFDIDGERRIRFKLGLGVITEKDYNLLCDLTENL